MAVACGTTGSDSDFMAVTSLLSHGLPPFVAKDRWLGHRHSGQCIADGADMLRAGAAAASDDLCPGGRPCAGKPAKVPSVRGSGPATVFGVPAFAGVGVDDNRLASRLLQLGDQRQDQLRLGAVDANGDDLLLPVQKLGAMRQLFAV